MEPKLLTPAQRLYAALDFRPSRETGKNGTHAKIMALVKALAKSGIGIKLNSDIRVWGEGIIDEIRSQGLNLFADLKLTDVKGTLERDAEYLSYYAPEILTAMCFTSRAALIALKNRLPKTEVIGVTVLTDIPAFEIAEMFDMNVSSLAARLALQASKAGLDGLVCSPHEASVLRELYPQMSLNTPGIRDPLAPTKPDEQQRTMTVDEALSAGSTRLIVGRPIVDAPKPYDAAMRFLDLIDKHTNSR